MIGDNNVIVCLQTSQLTVGQREDRVKDYGTERIRRLHFPGLNCSCQQFVCLSDSRASVHWAAQYGRLNDRLLKSKVVQVKFTRLF